MQQPVFQQQDYLRLKEQPLAGSTFLNWFKVLKKNRFHIDMPYLPRALYVTLMISFLSPFRWIEKRRIDPKLNEVNVTSPLFVLGHFRSGTTFLHYLLGQDPSLSYVSTFETMTPAMMIENEDFFKNLVMDRLPAKRPMDDLEMHASLPYEEEYAISNLSPYSFYHGWYFPRRWKLFFDQYVLFKDASEHDVDNWKQVYHYFLKKISYKNHGKRILLKNPVNTARVKFLLELYPDAKFIHIYRNPYEVYFSTWKLYRSILTLFSFQRVKNEVIDEYILYSYQKLYERFLEQKKLIPKKNLIEFSYQDFIADPLHFLKESYDELGLPGFSTAEPLFKTYQEKHRNYKASKYQITDEVKKKVLDHWAFMFDAYGFIQ